MARLFRLIVAGGRDFDNYLVLEATVSRILSAQQPLLSQEEVAIVSGGAAGADTLAARYALIHTLALHVYTPLWDVYGKSAGYRRNELMANHADAVLVFWNGSKGTKHMIDIAYKKRLPITICNYAGDVTFAA